MSTHAQKKDYSEFKYVYVVDTLAIPHWADSIRNEIKKGRLSLDGLDSIRVAWDAATKRTEKEVKAARKEWRKDLNEMLRKKGYMPAHDTYKRAMDELKEYEMTLPVYISCMASQKFMQDAVDYVVSNDEQHQKIKRVLRFHDSHIFSLNNAVRGKLLTEDVICAVGMYEAFVHKKNTEIDSLMALNDEYYVEKYGTRGQTNGKNKYNLLPHRQMKVKNPDYNPAELEWAWFTNSNTSNWKRVKIEYPEKEEYYVHPQHPEFKIREECSYPRYIPYLFAFKNDSLAASQDVTEEPRDYMTTLILGADYEQNKYNVKSESPNVIKYVKDMIYNGGMLEKREDYKRRDDEAKLNIKIISGKI